MNKTNCVSCDKEIDLETSPDTPECTMCFDCNFDFKIATGAFYV